MSVQSQEFAFRASFIVGKFAIFANYVQITHKGDFFQATLLQPCFPFSLFGTLPKSIERIGEGSLHQISKHRVQDASVAVVVHFNVDV